MEIFSGSECIVDLLKVRGGQLSKAETHYLKFIILFSLENGEKSFGSKMPLQEV